MTVVPFDFSHAIRLVAWPGYPFSRSREGELVFPRLSVDILPLDGAEGPGHTVVFLAPSNIRIVAQIPGQTHR